MANVDEQAIECLKLETAGTRDTEILKRKESLLLISAMRQQSILKCGKRCAVVDVSGTAHVYASSTACRVLHMLIQAEGVGSVV